MDSQKVDMYIIGNQKFFPPSKMGFIREKLLQADDSKFVLISSLDLIDPTTILIVSIFLGALGIDRFMIGNSGMGILKLFTLGLCGILTLIDWFSISNKAKELNYNKLIMVI